MDSINTFLIDEIKKYIGIKLNKNPENKNLYLVDDTNVLKNFILNGEIHDLRLVLNKSAKIFLDLRFEIIFDYKYVSDGEYILILRLERKEKLLQEMINIFDAGKTLLIESEVEHKDIHIEYTINPIFLIENGCIPDLDGFEYTFVYGHFYECC